MRLQTILITGVLATCMAVPALAAKRQAWTPTFAKCDALAAQRGVASFERRASEGGPSAWKEFMTACLAGKVDGLPPVAPRVAAVQEIPGKFESCHTLAIQRGIADFERRSSEGGRSAWKEFMVDCLAGRIR